MTCIDMCWSGTVFKVLHKKKIKQDADVCVVQKPDVNRDV